jgi:hypothetical protein
MMDQTKLKEELEDRNPLCKFSWEIYQHGKSYGGIGEKLAENIVLYRSENGPLKIESS